MRVSIAEWLVMRVPKFGVNVPHRFQESAQGDTHFSLTVLQIKGKRHHFAHKDCVSVMLARAVPRTPLQKIRSTRFFGATFMDKMEAKCSCS